MNYHWLWAKELQEKVYIPLYHYGGKYDSLTCQNVAFEIKFASF